VLPCRRQASWRSGYMWTRIELADGVGGALDADTGLSLRLVVKHRYGRIRASSLTQIANVNIKMLDALGALAILLLSSVGDERVSVLPSKYEMLKISAIHTRARRAARLREVRHELRSRQRSFPRARSLFCTAPIPAFASRTSSAVPPQDRRATALACSGTDLGEHDGDGLRIIRSWRELARTCS